MDRFFKKVDQIVNLRWRLLELTPARLDIAIFKGQIEKPIQKFNFFLFVRGWGGGGGVKKKQKKPPDPQLMNYCSSLGIPCLHFTRYFSSHKVFL